MSSDITDLLNQASQQVAEVDFAAPAWAEAARRRARRRAFLASGTLAAALVLGVGLGWSALRDRAPAAPPAGSATGSGAATTASGRTTADPRVEPVWVDLPNPSQMDSLPRYAGEFLPQGRAEIDVADSIPLSQNPFAADERIDSVWVRADQLEVGVITSTGRLLRIDGYDFRPQSDVSGNEWFSVAPGAISADGRYVVIAQPGSAFVLDARAERATPWRVIDLPDLHLETATFLDGSTMVAVTSARRTHLLDVTTGAARAVTSVFGAGPVALENQAAANRVTGIAYDPATQEWRSVRVPNIADIRSAFDGPDSTQWASASIWYTSTDPTFYQGVLAMPFSSSDRGVLPTPAILRDVSTFELDSRSKGDVKPLAWIDVETLAVRAGGSGDRDGAGSDIVAWNVRTGELSHVGSVSSQVSSLVVRETVD